MIHSDNIPNFIESSTPRGLRLLMLDTNNKASKQFMYFDISSYVNKSGKIRWIAWYYSNVKDLEQEIGEAI